MGKIKRKYDIIFNMKVKRVFIEGPNGCGKSTLLTFLFTNGFVRNGIKRINLPYDYLHYIGLRKPIDIFAIKGRERCIWCKKYYYGHRKLMQTLPPNCRYLFDRSFLSHIIYRLIACEEEINMCKDFSEYYNYFVEEAEKDENKYIILLSNFNNKWQYNNEIREKLRAMYMKMANYYDFLLALDGEGVIIYLYELGFLSITPNMKKENISIEKILDLYERRYKRGKEKS